MFSALLTAYARAFNVLMPICFYAYLLIMPTCQCVSVSILFIFVPSMFLRLLVVFIVTLLLYVFLYCVVARS